MIDCDEIYEEYESGLDCSDWIKENKYWLDKITKDICLQMDIYDAFNLEDWRYCSCGGCI